MTDLCYTANLFIVINSNLFLFVSENETVTDFSVYKIKIGAPWANSFRDSPAVYPLIGVMYVEFYMHEAVIVGDISVLHYKRAWPMEPLNRTFY